MGYRRLKVIWFRYLYFFRANFSNLQSWLNPTNFCSFSLTLKDIEDILMKYVCSVDVFELSVEEMFDTSKHL